MAIAWEVTIRTAFPVERLVALLQARFTQLVGPGHCVPTVTVRENWDDDDLPGTFAPARPGQRFGPGHPALWVDFRCDPETMVDIVNGSAETSESVYIEGARTASSIIFAAAALIAVAELGDGEFHPGSLDEFTAVPDADWHDLLESLCVDIDRSGTLEDVAYRILATTPGFRRWGRLATD